MPLHKIDGIKKDGLQKYNVRINYTDNSGKPKQLTRTAYGKEAANDLERQLQNDIKTKGEGAVKRLTVDQLFEKYVAVKQKELRESSLDKSRRNYNLYVRPTMGDVRLDKLTIPMLHEWKVSIEQKENDGKPLSLVTRKQAYSIFSALLNFGVQSEYTDKNPLKKVGNFKDALDVSGKTKMSIYTAQQFSSFISTSRRIAQERESKSGDLSEWGYYVFFSIAFYTGLRKGEIHALRWSDLDGKLLSVKRSITQKLKGDDRETPPKNKSSIRTLQMPMPLIEILQEHKERQKALLHFSDEYRVCGGERSLRDTTIQKRNVYYAAQSDLQVIRIHDYRHSHVSVLANSGINIQEIARRLGHTKVEMTWNTYSHLYPHEEEKAVSILDKIR